MYPRPNILPDQTLGLPRSGPAKPETNAAPGLLSLCHPSVTSIGRRLIASGVSAPVLRGRVWRISSGRSSYLVYDLKQWVRMRLLGTRGHWSTGTLVLFSLSTG